MPCAVVVLCALTACVQSGFEPPELDGTDGAMSDESDDGEPGAGMDIGADLPPEGPVPDTTACISEDLAAYDILVVDQKASSVLRFDALTREYIQTFLLPQAGGDGKGQFLSRPSNIAHGPDGHLYVANFGPGSILKFDGRSGDFLDMFFFDTYFLEEPMDLVFRGSDLYVLGNDTWNVVVLDDEGNMKRNFGGESLPSPTEMELGPDGLLYIAAQPQPYQPYGILMWDPESGTKVDGFGDRDEIGGTPSGLAFDCDDALYVGAFHTGNIIRFKGTSPEVFARGTEWITEIHFGPDRNLYVATRLDGIVRFDGATGEPMGTGVYLPKGAGGLDDARDFAFVHK